MLEAVPDLRAKLDQATAEELADLIETFEVTTTYDKAANHHKISATVPAELVSQNETRVPKRKIPEPAKSIGEFVYSGGRI